MPKRKNVLGLNSPFFPRYERTKVVSINRVKEGCKKRMRCDGYLFLLLDVGAGGDWYGQSNTSCVQ